MPKFGDPALADAVYAATVSFIGTYYPSEEDLVPVFWEAAKTHLGHLTARSGASAFGAAMGFADSRDLVSPTVLGVFAILFTELPLGHNQGVSTLRIMEKVEDAVRRCGAGRELTRQLKAAATHLYRVAVEVASPPRPVEIYRVQVRERKQDTPSTIPHTWAELENLRRRRDKYDIFVDLASHNDIRYFKAVRGLQPKQKELLGYVISRRDTLCRISDIFHYIWLRDSRRSKYRAAEADATMQAKRVDRQRRKLFELFKKETLPTPFAIQDGCYIYRGSESFCVIPERPTLALEHPDHTP